ncbi:penicillin-insensitive murein endopeptidase [Labrys monachus]|uniref:Penicillin-insensitive murein endopeptidase n=1 Tax=Labrys monachus TaxID=217067 RepID=A0ABU0FP54_9HYPH|nr:penicillin-insensitive murein endopeptidase [Labrys monachus]MDQ0395820.1 penicillin-insensitive murein endopeptidase [Labrys monachus]
MHVLKRFPEEPRDPSIEKTRQAGTSATKGGSAKARFAPAPFILAVAALLAAAPAAAQDVTPPGFRLAPLADVTPATPAKQLFGRKAAPAALGLGSIGFYARGCLADGVRLPITGPTWQVMRLSRNRNWGNPAIVAFLKRLANRVPQVAGVRGLLVGDMAQPRGGPMITGHASHQIGLDADIWYRPMPDHVLSAQERETMSAIVMVRSDRLDVNDSWKPSNMAVVEAAAEDPAVERIFVNPAVKKAMCRDATGDRSWLAKVRPMYGHDYHFHVRLLCPKGSRLCTPQVPPPPGEGCGKELDYWFSDAVLHPKPPTKPPPPPHQITMSELPAACRQVLAVP